MKKNFKITIIQNDGRDCTMKIEEWKTNRWVLFDVVDLDSQVISEILVYEKDKASQGMFNLIIDDQRNHWMLC